jgi:23S rRNA (guanosine2251-2'-O)-methyltransferase
MRRRTKYIQVESRNAILELLQADTPLIKIFIASNSYRDPKSKRIVLEAGSKGIPIQKVSRRRIDRMARSGQSESMIALKEAPPEVELSEILEAHRGKGKTLFVLILDNIRYTQNIGALLRTAYASGVNCAIVSKRKDSHLTDAVIRTSMGASERIPIVQMNLFEAVKELKDVGATIVGIHMEGRPYYDENLKGDVAFVVGSEDIGISRGLLSRCDRLISIPMQDGIDSLNVSAAGAVVMFEKQRQDRLSAHS